jgi:N-ethylmaleimide reductase
MSDLFSPVTLGALALTNRIVMAPMTRMRVDADDAPRPIVADYYAQRAGAGLLISESIMVVPHGDGYGPLPGLYRAEQRAAWRRVVDAVHAAGGRIVAQLASLGRARHAPQRGPAPAPGWAMAEPLEPHHFTTSEVAALVDPFVTAAAAARALGFDGVELHACNGFLLDSFLRAGRNRRDDRYGGSIENRARLTLEVIDAVTSAIGGAHTALRLSPGTPVHGAPDAGALETYAFVLRALGRFGLAYLHLARPPLDTPGADHALDLRALRGHFDGRVIGAGNFGHADAAQAVRDGWLDAVAFGRPFIANPDLPVRFASGAPLASPDPATLYSQDARGYIDYPACA